MFDHLKANALIFMSVFDVIIVVIWCAGWVKPSTSLNQRSTQQAMLSRVEELTLHADRYSAWS